MAKYVDKASWEEEVLIPDTSTPVLGGQPLWEGDQFVEGFYNVPIAILADRTRFLKQRVEGVEQEVIEGLEGFLVAEENLADIPDPGQAKYNLGLNLVDNTRDIDKPISVPVQEALDEKVDKEVGKGLSENDFSNAYKNKLDGIAPEATKNASDAQLRDRSTHTGTQPISTVAGLQTALDSKVDKVAGMGLSQENYTTAEKNKLALLEEPHFKGLFPDLPSLEAAVPNPVPGDYAQVAGANPGDPSVTYVWDDPLGEWVVQVPEISASQVKSLYESNPDTNAFTDLEKSKLSGIATGATANQTDAYLLNRANHTGTQPASSITGLTKASVGLSNVDNTSDMDKPISTAVANALNEKADTSALSSKANTNLDNVSQSDARAKVGTGTMAYRDVTISTGNPSGGANGDFWVKV